MPLEIAPRPAVTARHDQFEVAADGLGRYTIDVSLPLGSDKSGTRYPVVLVVDGNLLFDIAQPTLHGRFASMGSMIPPAIVVGVGYPADEGMASFYARRNYDFHGPWPMTDSLGKTLQSVFTTLKNAENKPAMEMKAGGYDRFMTFLRDELLPALAGRYPIDLPGRHTLIGDSSGGHFVLRALYDPKSAFKRYVCISPGFGSAEGAIQQAEAAYAASQKDLDADLFICCGRVEIDEDAIRGSCRFGSGVHLDRGAVRDPPMAQRPDRLGDHESRGSRLDRDAGDRDGAPVGPPAPPRRPHRRDQAGAAGDHGGDGAP